MSRSKPPAAAITRPNRDCDICCGEGTVRLPIRKRSSAWEIGPADVPAIVEESHRLYACPECTGAVPAERARVLEQTIVVEGRIRAQEYLDSRRKLIAQHMADGLLRGGFITFEQTSPGDVRTGPANFRDPESYYLRGRLGVVSKNFVKSLDERITERQEEIARQTIAAAKENINLWGSSLNWTNINKDEACRQVEQSLHDVLYHRARWRSA